MPYHLLHLSSSAEPRSSPPGQSCRAPRPGRRPTPAAPAAARPWSDARCGCRSPADGQTRARAQASTPHCRPAPPRLTAQSQKCPGPAARACPRPTRGFQRCRQC
eukprot:353375-Chlamydomonas_euryale.AAC.2